MRGILFDDFEVEIDPRSVEYGGSWQGEWRDGKPTAWDPDLLRFFYEKLSSHSPPVFFLDIGASFGSYCLLPKFLENCRCHAFEPIPFVNDILEENIRLNGIGNLVAVRVPYALSDQHGHVLLYIPPDNDLGMACLSPAPQRFSPARAISVLALSLDSILFEEGLTHIKMDIEGHELMALIGAEKTIRRFRPSLLLEYDERNTAQFGYEREEILNLLQSWGYTSFEFLGPDGRDLWATP